MMMEYCAEAESPNSEGNRLSVADDEVMMQYCVLLLFYWYSVWQ